MLRLPWQLQLLESGDPSSSVETLAAEAARLIEGNYICGRAGCCVLPIAKFSGSQAHESVFCLPTVPNLILPTFLASQTIV
jgi:hypothetical protein